MVSVAKFKANGLYMKQGLLDTNNRPSLLHNKNEITIAEVLDAVNTQM